MSLTPEQIIELGKKIGNQINGLPEGEELTPERQQAVHDLGMLTIGEMMDPIDKEPLPEEVDIMDQFEDGEL